jgi:hypothetical protein
LAVEHAKDIVVRRHEELRRIGKRLVFREPARVGVAVRRQDRQAAHLLEQAARDGAGRRFDGEKTVVVHHRQILSNETRTASAALASCKV